jgi:glycerophosphoryl diester phosphodiesterase
VTVAHRAGNDPAGLVAAVAAGVDRVEADVHLFRGVLEVRHAKTVGPVPVLWDRWELHAPWTPRVTLAAVLDAADCDLYLDLKGGDPRLGPATVAAVRARHGRDLVVASRRWAHLARLRGAPGVRLVPTVGQRFELRRLLGRAAPGAFDAVSVHVRLLNESVAGPLRERFGMVYGWPVNDAATAERLRALGVRGLIGDDLGVLARAAGRPS